MRPLLALLPAAPKALREPIDKPATGGARQVVAIPLNAPGIAEVEVGVRGQLVVVRWTIDDLIAACGG